MPKAPFKAASSPILEQSPPSKGQRIQDWIAAREWLGDVSFEPGARGRLRIRQSAKGFVIELPLGIDPANVLSFLQDHERWLRNRAWVRDNRILPSNAPATDLQESEATELSGPFSHGWIWLNGQREPLLAVLETPRLWQGPGQPLELPANAWRAVSAGKNQAIAALKKSAFERLGARLATLAREVGLDEPPFRIAESKSFWGQRDSRGRIQLRYDLLQLPNVCQDHVIHHELAHAWHMDHSPAFWRQLAQFRPNWKAEMRDLHAWGRVLGQAPFAFAVPKSGQKRN